MVRSRVIDDEARTIASTRYGYDPLGRRALVQDNNAATLRTLYDGLGFDVVKESPVYANGGFTDTYNIGIQYEPAGRATGERYRYLDDAATATSEKYQYIEDNAYQTVSSRYTGERTMLYANGSPVAINRFSGTRGYLGTDILGSTRSVTDNHGVQESFYDYDIFGSPITGNYTTGADYGYLGKPYDSITSLYNYGYRDYSPQTVRFTTVDPIRDGSNWFAYVNNDPVNYVDLLGLLASDGQRTSLQISDNRDDLPENQIPTNPSTYHCDIMAWNQAVSNGQDPRGQNGEAPDLNDINVNTWFNSFPNNRSDTPVNDTSGYVFYDWDNDENQDHMEYYYTTSETSYTVMQTNGITTPVPREYDLTVDANGSAGRGTATYVPLNNP